MITTEILDLDACPPAEATRIQLVIAHDALGEPIQLPIIVLRGKKPGPTVGITSALHGNEVNGIPVIHKLAKKTDLNKLKGCIVCLPVVNVPAFKRQKRFIGRTDLNHLFPGKANGNVANIHAHRLLTKVVSQFDYLIDLHAASFGRVNSLYIRADMENPRCAKMARLQQPQLILHGAASNRTLRGAAAQLGIPAITVEIGNPLVFQPALIRWTLAGIRQVLVELKMIKKRRFKPVPEPILCDRSQWLYTDFGGLLTVLPNLLDRVEEGELIAKQTNIFGDEVRTYHAPFAGVVIGKSSNPVGQTGARILHLGHQVESL